MKRLNIASRWMICASVLILLTNSGCASLVANTPPPVLLQEDKIYTVPAGQEIAVELDHRPMKLTFPYPMKLMSIDRAIRDEQEKNDAMLKNVKAGQGRKGLIALITGVLSVIGGIVWIFVKKAWKPQIKGNIEVK